MLINEVSGAAFALYFTAFTSFSQGIYFPHQGKSPQYLQVQYGGVPQLFWVESFEVNSLSWIHVTRQ